MRRFWFPILLGTLLTAALFPLGVVFSKGGGETFSFIFFPFTSLLAFILRNHLGGFGMASGYTLFFLQYPVYFVSLKIAIENGKIYKALSFLLGLHALIMLVCFAVHRG